MKKLIEELEQLFITDYYKKATCHSQDLDKLRNDINNYLTKLASQGYLPENLSSVDVVHFGGGQITLDLLRAFKNCPKWQQEQICLQLLGLEPNDVAEFEYNNEGYIDGVTLNQSIEQLEMTLEIQ